MILGTRGSKLALIQTEMVTKALKEIGVEASIERIESHGDMDLHSPLYSMKGEGVFVNMINERVLSGEIDAAVHSAKDIPTALHEDLEICAVLEREDPRDAIVSHYTLNTLPYGATVGTSSLRRIRALENLRADLVIENIRGNIDTRISKVGAGGYDAIMVAAAALKRMGFDGGVTLLDIDKVVPAASQGIIAVVSRKDGKYSKMLRKISDSRTMMEMTMERKISSLLSLGCSSPVGILARCGSEGCEVRVRFYSIHGRGFMDFRFTEVECSSLHKIVESMVSSIPEDYGYEFS